MSDCLESRFHPNHLKDLRESGLSDETIIESGIKSVCPRDIDKIFGYETYAKSVLEIPYPGTDYSRYKMFYDETDKINPKTNDERPKYLTKKNSENHLYIPTKARSILQNLPIPLYITEGEKKALKATREGLPCVAISGLWSWSNGKKELIADFDQIVLDGRVVYIVPDSHFKEPDRHGKQKNLKQAVNELAYRLIDRGAKVFWVELPKGDTETKLDDYFCGHTIEDFRKLSVHEIRKLSIEEEIDNASVEISADKVKELLKRIALVTSASEQAAYINKLSAKTGIAKGFLRKDVEEFSETDKKPTQAELLIEIASQYKLFHDDTKEGYAYTNNVAIKIRGSQFKQLLARTLWQDEGIAPNSDALNMALNVIEAMAVHNGECIRLYNRVAEHEGNFYYDLSNGLDAVRITPNGWGVTYEYPILFKRYTHQQKQVIPKKGGNITKLFDFLNIKEERHRLMSLVYLISCFVPNIPHPIFHPWGDQGAGKTSMFTFFKSLIDPSKLAVMIAQRDHKEVVQNLEEHYLCPLDNLSQFPDWLSDLLSQACTGGGFSKRKLYTDDESVIFQIMRCIGINGINLLISRADLMDRTILLHMDRIEPSQRKEWKVLMQDFEEERPLLLGCIFEVLSKAMAIYPTVKLSNLPRMADFMTWGVAIAQASGYKADDFINAYQKNIESQNCEIINSNTLAQAVLTFTQDKETWSGTVKQAYEELEKLVTVTKDDNTFPKRPNKLRSHLNRIKANLLDYGIKFKIEDFNTEKGIPISFQKVPKVSSGCSGCSGPNNGKASKAEDNLNIQEVSSGVSSGVEPSKIKVAEDTERPEDKKQPFWKGEKKNITPVDSVENLDAEEILEVDFLEEVKNDVQSH